jgi:hypothetical protein
VAQRPETKNIFCDRTRQTGETALRLKNTTPFDVQECSACFDTIQLDKVLLVLTSKKSRTAFTNDHNGVFTNVCSGVSDEAREIGGGP